MHYKLNKLIILRYKINSIINYAVHLDYLLQVISHRLTILKMIKN